MMSAAVTWYGHSATMFEAGGVRVLVDPFFEGNPYAPDWRGIPRPDVILITHDHADHIGQAAPMAVAFGATVGCLVDLAPVLEEQGMQASRIVSWNLDGTVDLHGVGVTMTPAFHSANHGVPVGFVLELPGGITVYHAGDTGLFGDMSLIGQRFTLDLACLPVGGFYTMDGVQAARACALLGAKTALPMHYGTFGALASTAEAFVNALPIHAPACRPMLVKPGETCALPARS